MEWILKAGHGLAAVMLVLLAGPIVVLAAGMAPMDRDWRTASREPTGIAPDPGTHKEAIIQVYGARAFSWRGAFAIHSWIAVKREGAAEFVSYEVIGWNVGQGRSAVVRRAGPPDRRWYGAEPAIIADKRGQGVEALIDRLEAGVEAYPFKDEYRTWPGPNSNTFVAMLLRQLPELEADLPPTAIGKDFLGSRWADSAPSGTGWQLSFFGLAGIILGRQEGLEINLLGLSIGVDPLDLALRLPGIGRIGPNE